MKEILNIDRLSIVFRIKNHVVKIDDNYLELS